VSVSLPELLGTLGLLCLVYASILPAKSIPAGDIGQLATGLPAASGGSVFYGAPPEFLFERAGELCKDAIKARSIRWFTVFGALFSFGGIIWRAGPEMPSHWLVVSIAVFMAAFLDKKWIRPRDVKRLVERSWFEWIDQWGAQCCRGAVKDTVGDLILRNATPELKAFLNRRFGPSWTHKYGTPHLIRQVEAFTVKRARALGYRWKSREMTQWAAKVASATASE
jgi:hypothetical protein